jgi:SAM-dependent methyltransferase
MAIEQENQLRQKHREQLETFLGECGIRDFRGKRILEIGFKNGLFLDECYKAGLVPAGLEVLKPFCDTVSRQFPHVEALFYDGGKFPVPDTSFDFVVSFQVLEHVPSIEHIFRESARVLRPGGMMYHTFPNYFSFYEGHYAVLWFPFFNKFIGRAYLKLLRCYDWQIEEINMVKPRAVVRALNTCKDRIKTLSLGRAEFINKFNRHQIDKINHKLLRMVLLGFLAVPPLKVCLLYLMTRANFYYPFTVIAKRL